MGIANARIQRVYLFKNAGTHFMIIYIFETPDPDPEFHAQPPAVICVEGKTRHKSLASGSSIDAMALLPDPQIYNGLALWSKQFRYAYTDMYNINVIIILFKDLKLALIISRICRHMYSVENAIGHECEI